jgi:transposase
MAKHRIYSVEFKRQVVQDYLTGETLHGLAKRHDISRNLIRIWIAKHEAGALDSDTAAAKVLTEYEARIAALERLVGKLALENEPLKGAFTRTRIASESGRSTPWQSALPSWQIRWIHAPPSLPILH